MVIAVKTVQNPENHSTYPLFHDASLAWWNGVSVYDRNVFGGDYRYGPSFAMVLGPIAWLPYEIGAVVWALMNVGIAFWAIRALAQRVLPGMQSPLARNLLLAVSVFPGAHCLYSSQTNLLVFSLVAFAAIAILDERWWLAALLLAIPVHIKVWPLAGGPAAGRMLAAAAGVAAAACPGSGCRLAAAGEAAGMGLRAICPVVSASRRPRHRSAIPTATPGRSGS